MSVTRGPTSSSGAGRAGAGARRGAAGHLERLHLAKHLQVVIAVASATMLFVCLVACPGCSQATASACPVKCRTEVWHANTRAGIYEPLTPSPRTQYSRAQR
jgi:hypothetical protein